MGEIVFMGVLGVVSFGMFMMTYTFRTSIIDQSGGPALYPRLIILFLVALMLIRIVIILKTPPEKRQRFAFLEIFKEIRLAYLLQFLTYVVLLAVIGFKISTTIFLNVMIHYLSYRQTGKRASKRRVLGLGLITIMGVIGLEYCFTKLLNVPLPKGIWNI